MAGESAEAVALAQLERSRRLQDSARRWQQGAEGERATAAALAGLPAGWIVLHDLAWPGRQRANIDHVVVGPPGVVVIDTKNWSGRVAQDGASLRHGGRDRSTTAWGVESAATAIADAVAFLPRHHVHGALCFTGQGALDGFAGRVLVTSDATLVAALLSRPVVLSPREVWDHAGLIRRQVGSATDPRPTSLTRTPGPALRHPGPPTAGDASLVAKAPRRRTRRRTPRRRTDWRLVSVGVLAAVLLLQPQWIVGPAQRAGRFVAAVVFADFQLPAGSSEGDPTADRPIARPNREERQERREQRERRAERQAARATATG